MNYMKRLIRWPGALSEADMEQILPLLPQRMENYVQPFLDGGEMFLTVEAKRYFLNGKGDDELQEMYKLIKKRRQNFWLTLQAACDAWKKVEAHLYGVQEDLLRLAFEYPRRWKDAYYAYVCEVTDVLNRVCYWDLFGMALPDPADFRMELKHFVLRAMDTLSEKEPDEEEEKDVKVLLTAMKQAVYEFMVELYNREGLETGLHMAAMVFVLELSVEGGKIWVKDEAEVGKTPADWDEQMRPTFGDAEIIDHQPDGLLELHHDSKFQERMDVTRIWRFEAPTFLRKCGVTKDDFVFVRPPEGYPVELLMPFLDNCPGRWMIATGTGNQLIIEKNY